MKIFAGSANKPLAEKVARHLNLSVSSLEIHVFADGEKRVRVLEKVLDEDCVVVQPTAPPVDQNYMELFFIVDALRRSGAKSVTTVIPYIGYQRQDHVFREGEAVSFEVIVKELEAIGVDKVIAFDLHTVRALEVFKIPVVHLSALSLFAEKIIVEGSVLVSPDMGGIRRVKLLSEMLNNMPYATVVKNRDLATGEITISDIQGEIGKIAIIIDDMIASGSTIVSAAAALRERGVERIFVFATHAVFSGDAPQALQKLGVEKVFVTDSIDIPQEKQFEKLEMVSVAGIIAGELKEN